jgi:hypothetical protein
VIRRDGAKEILGDAFAGTDEEAIAAVEADTRTHFIVGECDNQSPEGVCEGHRVEPKPVYVPIPSAGLTVDNLLHRLWSKAVGTENYDKREWKLLNRELLRSGLTKKELDRDEVL